MSKMLINSDTLISMADAIRAKTNKTNAMTPTEMITEISSIKTDTILEIYTSSTTDCIWEDNDIITIPNGLFTYCTKLNKVIAPNATTIGSNVFANCTALTIADFSNASSFTYNTFANDSSFIALILRKTDSITILRYTSAFTNTLIAKGTGYIYVPSALIDSYKSANNWSTFADRFRALEDYTVDGTVDGELDESKAGVTTTSIDSDNELERVIEE